MGEPSPEEHLRAALQALGFTDDPEMGRTPELVAGLLREFLPGSPPAMSTFPAPGQDLVVLRDLPYHSLCAHHLLPFFGAATVAYVPGDRVAGLGAIARIVQHFARQPQLQERLSAQVADHLMAALGARSVGVRLTARQLCMEMRGARSAGTVETVSLRGEPLPAVEAALRGG